MGRFHDLWICVESLMKHSVYTAAMEEVKGCYGDGGGASYYLQALNQGFVILLCKEVQVFPTVLYNIL